MPVDLKRRYYLRTMHTPYVTPAYNTCPIGLNRIRPFKSFIIKPYANDYLLLIQKQQIKRQIKNN